YPASRRFSHPFRCPVTSGPQASTMPDMSRPSTKGSLSDLTTGYRASRIFQSIGLTLAAFTFSRISFGAGVGIGIFRNFITSRKPNVSILTTSIMVMRHSWNLLQLNRARTNSLSISTIHHVGSRDRRNDLIGCHDRTRVVRDIDVEGSMHHLVRVVRR